MFLLAGLGNPGQRYSNNRHNVGFKVIDEIVNSYNLKKIKDKFESTIFIGSIAAHEVIAVKPNTFMNLSGKAVAAFISYYNISSINTIIIHDDINLVLGKIKVKFGGRAGGHNGLKSIDSFIGQNYLRVRLGVSYPGNHDLVSEYVLEDFPYGHEQNIIADIIKCTVNNIALLLNNRQDLFLTYTNITKEK